jgi:hypothetical protein
MKKSVCILLTWWAVWSLSAQVQSNAQNNEFWERVNYIWNLSISPQQLDDTANRTLEHEAIPTGNDQQPDEETAKRALEREVKTTGNYLYGEALANTKDEAVRDAKTALVSEINKEILYNHDWQFANTIQAKDVEYYTDIIDLMRGNKVRVIAYVKKENLTAFFGDYNPNINLVDKDDVITEIPLPPETQPYIPNIPVVGNGDLLSQIVNAASPREIKALLDANKKNGKAVYGTMDKLLQPEAAYLLVFKRTGEIVAILDKGSNSLRKDLISGESFGRDIFNNNQIIWFQLFK